MSLTQSPSRLLDVEDRSHSHTENSEQALNDVTRGSNVTTHENLFEPQSNEGGAQAAESQDLPWTQNVLHEMDESEIEANRTKELLQENYQRDLRRLQNKNAELNKEINEKEEKLSAKCRRKDDMISLEREAKKAARLQLQNTEEQMEKLRKDLEECKAYIFTNIPTSQTNDKQVLDLYRQLCEGIIDWTHSTLGDFENLRIRLNQTGMSKQICDMINGYFHNGGFMRVFVSQPTAELPLIMWLVLCHYESELLHEDAHFRGYGNAVNKAVAVLENLKWNDGTPPDQMKLWKADLQKSALADEDLQERNSQRIRQVSTMLYSFLGAILPDTRGRDCAFNAFHKLTCEAAELSRLFSLSASSYELRHDFFPNYQAESRILWYDAVNRYKFINVKTGQDIRRPSMLQSDESGRVGVMLCVIFPALIRERSDKSGEIELEKATVLLEPDQALIKKGRGSG